MEKTVKETFSSSCEREEGGGPGSPSKTETVSPAAWWKKAKKEEKNNCKRKRGPCKPIWISIATEECFTKQAYQWWHFLRAYKGKQCTSGASSHGHADAVFANIFQKQACKHID